MVDITYAKMIIMGGVNLGSFFAGMAMASREDPEQAKVERNAVPGCHLFKYILCTDHVKVPFYI